MNQGALDLIDDAADVVSRSARQVGLLWLTALPSRLALTLLLYRAMSLGKDAPEYGHYLRQLSYLALGAWLLSLYGRLVFVRSHETLESERPPSANAWRVAPRDLFSYVAAAALLEALFWILFVTVGGPILLLLLAGLLPAALERGANPVEALKSAARFLGAPFRLMRLTLIFAVTATIAFFNLHMLMRVLLWLASGVPGAGVERYAPLLDLDRLLYRLLLCAGVSILLEPFWLASLAAHVDRLRAVSSGDDLRRWFEELRRA